ncbi:hypothetical protein LTR62_005011 [Meristemomyces frigidus]|uniref:Uncharacterized protein n=1 Tax=Meristemomyces frigidus TaxID=1508187 RepID=A0AAN7TQX5_9PEZI|nr:hypothetical protein LTR62_005011 [Meristemomyces frigidus]
MLGHSTTADAAARAVIRAHSLSGVPDKIAGPRAHAAYLAAIAALRTSLDTSDCSFVAVGLLTLYEAIRKDEPDAFFSHADGMGAIMRARQHDSRLSPLIRAAFYGNTHATFVQPLEAGTASPFDDPFWLDQDFVAIDSLSSETAKLRKLVNQGLIRLPGLIAKTRIVREHLASNKTPLPVCNQSVLLLAEALEQQLQDPEVENTLLHRVSIHPTIDLFDRSVVPYSFSTSNFHDKETLLLYWAMRLMLLKICLLLDHIIITHTPNPSHNPSASPTTSITTSLAPTILPRPLETEQDRLITNIMMFHQSGYGQANPFSMLWGALMHKSSFRGKDVTAVREWVLRRNEDVLSVWGITKTREELDTEADVLAGGRLGEEAWKERMRREKEGRLSGAGWRAREEEGDP